MAPASAPGDVRRLLVLSAETHTAQVRDVPWDSDGHRNLETLTALVGGLLEVVFLNDEAHLWINENGKYEGRPVNHLATRLARAAGAGLAPWDFIVGSAVVAGTLASDGRRDSNDHDVPQSVLDLCERAKVPLQAPNP